MKDSIKKILKDNRSKRSFVAVILLLGLLALPFFIEIYYIPLYYIAILICIPVSIYRIIYDEKFDLRFYYRWRKANKQKYWVKVFKEGIRYIVFVLIVVSISQLFGNGRTPLEVISKLSGSSLTWILIIVLLIFGLIGGLVACYENEKKYIRIYYKLVDKN